MQALADFYTLKQRFDDLQGIRITFIGDANNVARSLIEMGITLGCDMRFASPADYGWDKDTVEYFKTLESRFQGSLQIYIDPVSAIKGTDVLYTDTFVSMGQEDEYALKIQHFKSYQVNSELMRNAGEQVVFMHCLPAHRGTEVTNDVIDGQQSIVYDQAESRMVVSKGLFTYLLSKPV
jgi:ornithine carbamoyltransferase